MRHRLPTFKPLAVIVVEIAIPVLFFLGMYYFFPFVTYSGWI